jgi:hypothetical protein
MTMNPDTICRMSTEQINTALDRLQRELNALLEDQRLLLAERNRRMSAMPNRRGSNPEE